MGDNVKPKGLIQEKRTRAWYKCSNCRQPRKIKCEPQDRDWEGRKQKCDWCSAHDLLCSPNYKNKEDPGVERAPSGRLLSLESGSNNEGLQELEVGSGSDESRALGTPYTPNASLGEVIAQSQELDESSSTSSSPFQDRRARVLALTGEELKGKALSKLERLNLLGLALAYQSQIAPVTCQFPGVPQDYNCMSQNINIMIKEELHALFVTIYELGSRANVRGQVGDDKEIFLKLCLALERYSGLCDDRKRVILMKMASFFQHNNDACEGEHIMGKVADMHGNLAHPLHENPCLLLAESLPKTSEKARQILANLWQKTYGFDCVPTNLSIPPLQRASQMLNSDIVANVLSGPSDGPSGLGMFDQQALHLAAARGFATTVNQLMLAGAFVDARDLHNRTPLLLAAMNGHEESCLALLNCQADPNTRDSHGHTVLETAARGGHPVVVQRLVEWGAIVNSIPAYCASTPLQAAIESEKFSFGVAQCLIDHGADMDIPRFDGKTAISLAEERDYTGLTQIMRQKKQEVDSRRGQNQQIPWAENQLPHFDLGGYGYGVEPVTYQ